LYIKVPGPNTIKIITDEPTLDDVLDFKKYSQKLADIIINSTPRFSVGIFGGWGTGKTSLMLMIENLLRDNDPKILTVWFDAWRYEREENLAVIPFLRTMKLALDASQHYTNKWEVVKNGVKRSAAAFLSSTKVTYGIKDIASAETDFGKIVDSLIGDGSVGNDKHTVYYYVTEYLERALKHIREDDKRYRIVVFVDDLDRCSPEKSLEVLESIKSFFDIEGMVYVIGMDSETINSLVKKKYGEEYAAKGLDYLQKIVQLPFHIPIWKEVDISNCISNFILKGLDGSDLLAEFNKRNKNLIVKAVQLNPREVKRFINNIILMIRF
jgi:KAP family P-loop domain